MHPVPPRRIQPQCNRSSSFALQLPPRPVAATVVGKVAAGKAEVKAEEKVAEKAAVRAAEKVEVDLGVETAGEEVVEGVVVVAAHDEGGAGEDGDAGVDVAADFAVGGVVRVPGEDEGEPAHDEAARDVPEEQGFEADAGDEGGDECGVLECPVAHGVAV